VFLHSDDYRSLARERLSAEVWDFIDGGSGAELSVNANRALFEQTLLRPRVLVDVSMSTPEARLFGSQLSTPLAVAPTAYHRLMHHDGELATAHGAGAAGALYVVAMLSSVSIEDIAAAATGPLWLQLYWLRDREVLAEVVSRAKAAGYGALMLTVDAPQLGRRLREMRRGFALDPDIRAVNLDPALMSSTHTREAGRSAVATHFAATFEQSLTWSDLAWLRGLTDLPLLLKGVLTPEDARLAVEHGVDGIVVSNHGGRQLDGAVPSLLALPSIVDAVAGAMPVLFDGGVRTGRDVFIALACGAAAVLLGRPVLWSLAAGGADGVRDLITLLTEELTHTMALAGRPRVADIGRDVLA
jgi:4-hydroxymandelate oxidase